MTENSVNVPGQPEGNGYTLSDSKANPSPQPTPAPSLQRQPQADKQPEVPQDTPKEQKSFDPEAFEQRIMEKLQAQFATREYANRAAQSASDRRFHKVRQEIDKALALNESVGIELTPQLVQQIENRLMMDMINQEDDDDIPNRVDPTVDRGEARPPHFYFVDGILNGVGMTTNDPEFQMLDFAQQHSNPDAFVQSAERAAQAYMARKYGQQPQAQAPSGQTQGNQQPQMPNPASVPGFHNQGTPTPGDLREQYNREMAAIRGKPGSANLALNIRAKYRRQGLDVDR